MLEMPLLPLFQSTLSMRRATEVVAALVAKVFISIHALHEESDFISEFIAYGIVDFNPRSP